MSHILTLKSHIFTPGGPVNVMFLHLKVFLNDQFVNTATCSYKVLTPECYVFK